jgi:ribosomal protein S18 acetylase RimI-like enzyme
MGQIKTERFVLTLGRIQDLTELESIEKECEEYFSFDPQCEENHSCSIKDCITVGDIPVGGKKENYYFYCIRQNNEIIGFLDYYLEYQKKDIAYFSSIYIREINRNKGIGNEILDTIINKFSLIGIKEIHLHVSLRNVMALKFWVKHGFNHIINVGCNGNLVAKNFGGIELIRKI